LVEIVVDFMGLIEVVVDCIRFVDVDLDCVKLLWIVECGLGCGLLIDFIDENRFFSKKSMSIFRRFAHRKNR
jgi:hypothetical protein